MKSYVSLQIPKLWSSKSSVKWSHLGQIPNFQKIDLGQLLSNK